MPACVSHLPGRGAPFRRSRRSRLRRLAAGRRARRLRPDAGDGLPAGQQIPAAAAAPDRAPAAPARAAALEPAAPRRRPLGWLSPALASIASLSRLSSPCIPRFPSSSSPRPPAPATACWPCSASWRRSACCRRTAGFGFAALALALAAITVGLLSSTLHLGHPERAWRAFSQWRSSWLSREGVLALATYLPAGAVRLGWVCSAARRSLAPAGVLAALGAVVTVCCTGDDLRLAEADPRAGTMPGCVPSYLRARADDRRAVARGAARSCFAPGCRDRPGGRWRSASPLAALIKLGLLALHRRRRSAAARRQSATGLGDLGTVRLFERAAHRRQLPAAARWASASRASTPPSCAASPLAAGLRAPALLLAGCWRCSTGWLAAAARCWRPLLGDGRRADRALAVLRRGQARRDALLRPGRGLSIPS